MTKGGGTSTRVAIDVMLKNGILDPQGKTVQEHLPALGFDGVTDVRVGKHIEVELSATDDADLAVQVEQMAMRLLSNPVIEDFTWRLVSRSDVEGSVRA